MNLVSVPSEQSAGAACTSCGAALVADQRYCLSCGAPSSPVRLAFLDVLEGDRGGLGTPSRDGWVSPGAAPGAYMPVAGQPGLDGWLRRYAGLLSLFTVLLTCLIAGLLVGHWVTQSKSSAPTLIKVEGLSGAPAAASTTPSAAASGATASKSSAAEEAEEAKAEAKETKAEKAPPPAPVKVTSTKLKKLSTTTGKKHAEEINALGAQPIETGG